MDLQLKNKTQKLIEQSISNFSESVKLDKSVTYDDVKHIVRNFMRKHPEVFWFSHQYLYDENTRMLLLKYNFTKEKANFFKCEIDKVIKDDFRIKFVKTLSEIERLLYVYKWIAKRTTYNEYSSFNQTIYSILINRNSVCTGYAKTAQYLLGLVGMESQLVFGKFHSDKSEYGRHGWNIVKVNDRWYHVDFCLADHTLKHLLNHNEMPIERDSILWNYYGVTTNKILKNRTIEFVETLPPCNDTISDIPELKLIQPTTQLICCKSNSGTSARIYLNSFNINTVIKVSRHNSLELLRTEASMLTKLSGSSHVIKLYGLTENGLELEQLTPWAELLNSHYYNPTEFVLRNILRQLIIGLIECRDRGITYSDIHYNNVFVTKDGTYKWGDFGIAFCKQEDDMLPREMISIDGIPKGSFWFMSPETYYQKVFNEASAIYSVSMMAYFVMNNMQPPFWTDEDHQKEALSKRLNGEDIPMPAFVDRFINLWQLVKSALSFNPDSRFYSYEDFLRLLNDKEKSREDINITEPPCLQIELNEIDEFMMVHVDNDGCIDDTYAEINDYELDKSPWVNESDLFASTIGGRCENDVIYDSDSFACTCGCGNWNIAPSPIDVFPTAPNPQCSTRASYGLVKTQSSGKHSIWWKMFGKKEKTELVNASAYAPAEITPYKHFIIRIFIHRPEESGVIDLSIKDVDKTAVKKANKSLDLPIKNGDKITVQLSISDGVVIDEPVQHFFWRGNYIECDFGCELIRFNQSTALCKAIVAINNVPCGDLKFIIEIVSTESEKVYTQVEPRRYSKIFISYAHADYAQVRGIAEGCKMNGTDYFFDRHTLQAGDIFKDKILQYIDNADLFVLCWSKNAAESEWVQIERKHALALIEHGNNQLSLYPLSIPPEAPLPTDMSDKYNFATL